MIDYYSELHIDKALGLREINKELSRLESIWKRRELINPEKATKILAIIIDARKVFETDVTRREYDVALANSKQELLDIDSKEYNRQTLKKWQKIANDYYRDGQYDLSKAAIIKALSYSNEKDDNDILFALASDIYKANGDNRLALDYINKAIIICPERPGYYLVRGLIYIELEMNDQDCYSSNNDRKFNMQIESFQTSVRIAEKNGDRAIQAQGLGLLAYTYYQHNFQEKAEQFALQAKNLGGDSKGNAERVLDEIEHARKEEKKRREMEEVAEVARKAKAEREETERIAKQKKREELERIHRERREREENWKKGVKILNTSANIIFVVCVAWIVCTSFTSNMLEIDTDILTIASFGTIAFHSFANSIYRNEYFKGSTLGGITISIVAGLATSFYIATIEYTKMGSNIESVNKTWEIFGALVALVLVIIVSCRIFGKISREILKPRNDNGV